jgi:hypothetical protein
MDIRKELDKKIEKKKQEILDLEKQLENTRHYLLALEDTRKLLPKDAVTELEAATLRAGTGLAKVQDILKKEGKPLHIDELLRRLGKPIEKKQKISLSGSLASYVRVGKVFTRPAANTFGLLEFGNGSNGNADMDEPPADFGLNQ